MPVSIVVSPLEPCLGNYSHDGRIFVLHLLGVVEIPSALDVTIVPALDLFQIQNARIRHLECLL